ncbi:bacterial proteasome activator family protein [Arthrobacter sp.]|uniref:bacterial proteasome activator family protein n=1 Tax=Arthrobacter sp. TaxID=1667 RepID=UPI0026DF600C|nr:bacterial proteasome activator family protein [Arthrobacter sp.]MDO5752094.1 bacterial proteasome activator family protein [Arthrobacter sp.]
MSENAQNSDLEAAAVGEVVDSSASDGQEAAAAEDEPKADAVKQPQSLSDMVDQPAKVMRIGTMVKQLLDEVKSAPLDDAARTRLAEIHQASITELEAGLAPELVDELHRLSLPFADNSSPSDAELRIAQAQLVGWLEGLFHGIQTALAAQAMASQQTAARLALRQLPPGTMIAPGVIVGENGEPQRAPAGHGHAPGSPTLGGPDSGGPGQYL